MEWDNDNQLPGTFPTGAANTAPQLSDMGSWARNVAGSVIEGAIDMYKYRTVSRAGGIPAIDPNTGQVYTEGRRAPSGVTVGATGLTISGTWLIVGAAVVGYLLLRK